MNKTTQISAIVALALSLFSCDNDETKKHTCEYNNKTYEEGESFPSIDGCNTCECDKDTGVSCTEIACNVDMDSDKNDVDEYICTYNGKDYKQGDKFPATDGCNTCECIKDTGVACTEIACQTDADSDINDDDEFICTYNGKEYKDGDTFKSIDGCNTCGCCEGVINCTTMECSDTDPEPSDTDPVTCFYDNKEYNIGDTFPSKDDCNRCECFEDGHVGCTEINCPPNDSDIDETDTSF